MSSSYPPERTMDSAPSVWLPEMPAWIGRCTPLSRSSARSSKRVPSGFPGTFPKMRSATKKPTDSRASQNIVTQRHHNGHCIRRLYYGLECRPSTLLMGGLVLEVAIMIEGQDG